ncbi:MAG: 50S ribosomal protein L21 [bacterium]|jgi:large subunit ribosomal protein L21
MFAVLELSGKQFMVEEGTVVRTFALDHEPGQSFTCDKVLLVKNGGEAKIGKPYVDGAKVTFEVLRHAKGKKITVFKFTPKENYKRTHGHRDHLTYIKCTGIEG